MESMMHSFPARPQYSFNTAFRHFIPYEQMEVPTPEIDLVSWTPKAARPQEEELSSCSSPAISMEHNRPGYFVTASASPGPHAGPASKCHIVESDSDGSDIVPLPRRQHLRIGIASPVDQGPDEHQQAASSPTGSAKSKGWSDDGKVECYSTIERSTQSMSAAQPALRINEKANKVAHPRMRGRNVYKALKSSSAPAARGRRPAKRSGRAPATRIKEPEWSVDRIVGHKRESGRTFYLVRWDETWEPASALYGSADDAIAEYFAKK